MKDKLRREVYKDFKWKRNYDGNFRKILNEREVTTRTLERIQMTTELRLELSEDFELKRNYDRNCRKNSNDIRTMLGTFRRF